MSIKFNKALIVLISALCCVQAPSADPLPPSLAFALYTEGNWVHARSEALRQLIEQNEDEASRMIAALAALRINAHNAQANQTAQEMVAHAQCPMIQAHTAYELGKIRWESGDIDSAFTLLQSAYYQNASTTLALQAAFLLNVLTTRHRELLPDTHPLRTQLRTSRALITPAIRMAANPPPPARNTPRALAQPAIGLIRFYQTQIGPAIGQRCSMHPSCSRYSLEACQTYGWRGIPMTADRLIRETDHVQHRIHPVILNGEEKYYDPVKAHSQWFRRYNK